MALKGASSVDMAGILRDITGELMLRERLSCRTKGICEANVESCLYSTLDCNLSNMTSAREKRWEERICTNLISSH